MSKAKSSSQLGMNHSTASNRLVKNILFDFVIKAGINCYHCDKPLTRDTFSVEHKTPWLNSEDPEKLFFDLNNISYSHLSCNSSKAKRKTLPPEVLAENIKKSRRDWAKKNYCPEKRRAQYLKAKLS